MKKSDLPRRIADKITVRNGCWLWTAGKDRKGYAKLKWNNKSIGAHRIVYALLVDEISDGLTVDHLCPNKHCVNPRHMEIVTVSENAYRRWDNGLCPKGHKYDEENTYWHKGKRHCRKCHKARSLAWYYRNRNYRSKVK